MIQCINMSDAVNKAIEVLCSMSEDEQEAAARAILEFASRHDDLLSFDR